jgi:hypothetical protein
VIDRWLREHGATAETPATTAIGISVDEIERASRGRDGKRSRRAYPLLDLGLDRAACQALIARAGLPVPGRSACFFCPFHRPQAFAEMRRDRPALFDRAVQLERLLNERRLALGKDPVWLTRFNRPLDEAIAVAQSPLFHEGPEGCDDGMCWT